MQKTQQDHGSEKQLPFDIAHQVQNTLKILESLPKNIEVTILSYKSQVQTVV